jgi:hypothetical protein
MGRRRCILARQGEADPIVDLMNDCCLKSLLGGGAKTWQGIRGEFLLNVPELEVRRISGREMGGEELGAVIGA